MATVAYYATRSSYFSWTLAQTIRLKIFAFHSWNYMFNVLPARKHPVLHIQERICNIHQIFAELSLLFASTSSLSWSFNDDISYAAFEALRIQERLLNKQKHAMAKALLCLPHSLKILPLTLCLSVRYRRVKYFTLTSPLSKVSKNFLHPEELKLKEVLYFNVGF